ncbi:non-ribosomal peptide synthetase [Micromonospora luteifusca]|uniref:non-ribosomal peptide synthetase n=1 Tax=Micromonospora luteifusca TaxID=709860 RepID=UPI0033B3EBAB
MIETQRDAPAPVAPPPTDPLPKRFPLTDMQVAYLVGKSRLIELGGRQNYYVELDVVGLDPVRTEEALNLLVARQEHLRTVIHEDGEQEVLDVEGLPRLRVPVVNLVDVGEEERYASLRRTRERMCDQGGLDPTGWPLFEAQISQVRAHRSRVHLRMNLILLDGPSLRRCILEWLELYRDPHAALPPVERTFREWRLALAEHERSEAFQAQWRYWEQRLDALPGAPELPLARQPGSIEAVSFTGRRSFLTKAQWDNFRANYRKHRVLGTTGLLHVYAEILGGWAAEPHFCLNVVHQRLAAGQPGEPFVVGQRSATLPLEVDLREGGFWDRARRLQQQLFRDMQNSEVTAVRISREMAARSGWTQRASFPYVFTSNQGPGWDTAVVDRPAFRLLDRIQHTPQVLIDDQLRDSPDGGVSSMLDFVEEAFPTGLPDLMVGAYRQLLEALGAPDGAEREPDLVPPGHRELIAGINDTAAPLPAGRLEDNFLAHAAANPAAVAIIAPTRTLTYGELEAESRAAAAWLREHAVGRGSVVPVVMAKGWEQVVAVLGVLRAGAAYCPIDAAMPEQRLRHLLDECGATVLLGQSGTRPDLGPSVSLPVLEVDRVRPGSPMLPEADGDPTDLAYVIYTSGSTGQPKGVMIEHRSALNTVLDINRRIVLAARDRIFGISSLSFDLSVWDVFGTLSAGATLVIPEATARPDPVGWADTAARHGVTVWNSVPALAEMLIEVAEQRPELGRPPVRAFLLSGDWIPTSLPGRARSLWPDTRIIAMGGATEASIWSNIYEVDEVDPEWRSIPYGRPLTNQTMRVLDHRLDVRPPWAVGRIYIGGVGLACGYWRDDERTAERFVRHPDTGERLYWTGDLGRYWPDGTIEFIGREDRQVKVQGFRVEPGEVEAAIRLCPGVRDCVVCVDGVPGGQVRLLSLVVPEPGQELDGQVVAAHLRTRLPHYMVPGRIQVVDCLPLTANGKVDGAKVSALLADGSTRTANHAEITPLMNRLGELWADLLQLPAIDPDDNFFAIGGNSLQALRMINRVRAELGVDLPLGQVFEAPTIRQLALSIDRDERVTTCAVELADRPGPHLFLFHVVGGSIARYVSLASAWTGPVRAFQSRALVDPTAETFPATMEAMAAEYREELRRHQPEGPYVLGGWSSGGLLAYEVARQLTEQGQRSHVFMVDSETRELDLPSDERERHLAFLMGLTQGAPPETLMAAVRGAAADGLDRAARDAAVAHGLLPPEMDLIGYRRLMRIQEHELALMSAYRPGPLDQPTLLFVAAEETGRADPVPAWRALCPGIDVRVVPGDHFTVSHQFPDIARQVTSWISR